ncbi:hypothetical protein ABPG74_014106 [Tetrahymena malaccensis]
MNPFFNNKFSQFPPQNSQGQFPPQQGFQQQPPQQGFQQYPPQQGYQQYPPQQGYQQYPPQQGFQQYPPQQYPPQDYQQYPPQNQAPFNPQQGNYGQYPPPPQQFGNQPPPPQINSQPQSNSQGNAQAQCNNDHPNYTKDRLSQGKKLDQDKWLVSQNQKFQAGIQEDGNLVVISLVNNQRICTFSSMNKKKGDAPHKLALNSNGNLEIQDYRNAKLWDSDTLNQGQGPYILIMQNDGNLVLFDRNKNITWNTNTKSNYPVTDQPKCNNNHSNYTKDRLKQGSRLEQDKWLVSQNQKYYAGVQGDGNLVISTNQNYSPYSCIWSSMTKKKGDGSNYISLNGNGVLSIQDKRNATLWDSDTLNQGMGPYTLIMQNDGNLALFDRNDRITWCTNTTRE